MNYFELFNLPLSFKPDQQLVSQRYFELQKKYHPDFFANASDDKKEEVLEMSAMANKAYKIFRNEEATIKYVLQQKGLLQEEEKYNLPPQFLMEVMELNEMKMDGADEKELKDRTAALHQEISNTIRPIIENYRDGITPDAELLRVKDYYFKLKYLDRLREGS